MTADLSTRESVEASASGTALVIREPTPSDIPEIGAVYFTAYEEGLAGENIEEATADIAASYDGEYGEFWMEGSAVAEVDGEIVGVLLAVRQAPWDQTPRGPFIIELFVGPDYRGRGVASRLLDHCLDTMASLGAESVGLRVLADNQQAQSLYAWAGFVEWTP